MSPDIVPYNINLYFFKFQTDENLKRNLTYKNFTIKQLTNQIPNVNLFIFLYFIDKKITFH